MAPKAKKENPMESPPVVASTKAACAVSPGNSSDAGESPAKKQKKDEPVPVNAIAASDVQSAANGASPVPTVIDGNENAGSVAVEESLPKTKIAMINPGYLSAVAEKEPWENPSDAMENVVVPWVDAAILALLNKGGNGESPSW